MSVFKRRRVPIDVITTEVTELDVVHYGVSEERLEQIGVALKSAPLSRNDTDLGGGRIRHFEDYDVAFIVTADGQRFLVTIANIQPKHVEPPLEDLLRKVGLIAMLRGATGV